MNKVKIALIFIILISIIFFLSYLFTPEKFILNLQQLGIIPEIKPHIAIPPRIPREVQEISIIDLLKEKEIKFHGFTILPKIHEDHLRLHVFIENDSYHYNYLIKELPESRYFTVIEPNGNVTDFYIKDDLEDIENFTSESFDRYIVEFKEDPILVKRTKLEKQIKSKEKELTKPSVMTGKAYSILKNEISYLKNNMQIELRKHENKIKASHETAKNDMERIFIEKEGKKLPKIKEFKEVFNGISLKASKETIQKIRELPYVKKLYPDVKVHTFLTESIPLINADDIWNLGFTGSGIKIAIVDTGVDYTHPDLGDCTYTPNATGDIVSYSLNSPHPYPNYYDYTWTITKPGFTNIAVHFTSIETEWGYDYVYVLDGNNNELARYTGSKSDIWSPSTDGDTIKVRLVSDYSITRWGFAIDSVLNGTVVSGLQKCQKVIGGYDFVNDDDDPMDDHGHGTHCAGIAAGNGTLKGVAPDAKILAYKVLNFWGSGYESDIIAAIERAINDSADVISMSLGMSYYWFDNCYDVALSNAVENAVDAGVVVVIAAGNDYYYKTIAAPGCAEKVITVGATDKSDAIAYFSSKGPVVDAFKATVKPDVVAPGYQICSAQWDGAWSYYQCYDNQHVAISGTSMATPHVAGLAALLKQEYPYWTPEEVKSAIMGGAIDLNKDAVTQGAGRVDALKSHDISILTYPPSIGTGVGDVVDTLAKKSITIKNLRSYEITINLEISPGQDILGNSYDVATLNVSSINVPANSISAILLSINASKVSDAGGILFGKITLETEGNDYIIPYASSTLSYLNVTVVGENLELYPDLCLHDDNITFYRFVTQGEKITGNNYTFSSMPNKNYTVYAIGDWENYSLSYILMDRVYVPFQGASIILNLSEARPFNVRGEGIDGSEIDMYEFLMGFTTYRNLELRTFGETISYKNVFTGNRTIYISNKPDSDHDIDIVLKYSGIPVKK